MFNLFEIIRLSVGGLVAALGIPGNIIIIAVFLKQGVKNSTDVAFIALAFVDFIASILNGMKIPMVFFHNEHPWACYTEIIGGRAALYAGLFLTISVAVYRYQAVCKPFDRQIRRRAASLISVSCMAIGFGIHVPFFFTISSYELGNGTGIYGCNIYGNTPWGQDVYAKSQAAVFCISAFTITVLYLLIYKFIRAQQIIRNRMKSGAGLEEAGSGRHADVTKSTAEPVSSVSASVSVRDVALSTAADSENISKQAAQASSLDDRVSGEVKANGQSTSTKTKQPSKKLQNKSTDHKTTRVVIIITVTFFLFWFPSILLDQIPEEERDSVINGATLYTFYQVKYINNFINVFAYLFTYRRFRNTFCQTFLGRNT